MRIGFEAFVENGNAAIDYITCSGPEGIFTLTWESSEWTMESYENGFHYDACLKAVLIEDENGRERYANGLMDLIKGFTSFEVCLRDRDTEEPANAADMSIFFSEVDGSEYVTYSVPEERIKIENIYREVKNYEG